MTLEIGPLRIIYYDNDIIIVDKPSGLLSVPGKAEDNKDCVELRAQNSFKDARIVHRIDLSTSGLLLLARGIENLRILSKAFETRKVSKKYIALLHGRLEKDRGTIEAPIITDWPNRPRQMVDFERGRHATTHYKVLSRNGENTRVEFTPITGRSHQLRVHSIHIGHAICGDHFYIGEDEFPRLCLHAAFLSFEHPRTKKEICFESPAPF